MHSCFRVRDPSFRVGSVKSSSSSSFLFFFLTSCTEVAQYGLSTPLSALNLEHLHKSQFQSHVSKNKSQIPLGYWEWMLFHVIESKVWMSAGYFWEQRLAECRPWGHQIVCFDFCLCCSLCSRWRLVCSSRNYTYLVLSDVISERCWAQCTYTHTQTLQSPIPVFKFRSYTQFNSLCTTVTLRIRTSFVKNSECKHLVCLQENSTGRL